MAGEDTWDLASLFADDAAWEEAFQRYERRIKGYEKFRGKLGTSAAVLAKCLEFDSQLDRRGERLGVYAFLRTAEDQTNSGHQRMLGRFQNAATRAVQAASFIRPELLALPADRLRKLMAHASLKAYRLLLERLVRFKPHTLGQREEELLAMQGEMAQVAARTFRQLHDADLKFGFITNEKGEKIELSNATFSQLLHSPKRSVRREAFQQYYTQFAAHENTLAATLSGNVLKDVYYARAAPVRQLTRCRALPGQRTALGVRQSDRGGAPASTGRASLLRRAPPQDAFEGHSSVRYLRADPQQVRTAPHLGPSRAAGARVARAVGRGLPGNAGEGSAESLV